MSKTSLDSLESALKALHEVPDVGNFIARCAQADSPTEPIIDLVFSRFREDVPDIEALAEFLGHQVINYVVPLKKRREVIAASSVNGNADFSLMDRLRKQAKTKFIEFHAASPGRASEVGELLAYLMALQYLGAFQVASKMALKTSGNMPVYGLDGIHARFDNGVMVLYFLESKLSDSAASGIADYVSSMSEFSSKRKQYLLEYSIVSDLSNLDSLDPANLELALQYFDVYGSKKSQRIERSVGFICYSEKKLFNKKLPKKDLLPPQAHEDNFEKNYAGERARFHDLFSSHLKAKELDTATHRVFLLAVPDKDVLRELFNTELKS